MNQEYLEELEGAIEIVIREQGECVQGKIKENQCHLSLEKEKVIIAL